MLSFHVVPAVGDYTAPVILYAQPVGNPTIWSKSPTRMVTLLVNTDEKAICKYDSTDKSYDDMARVMSGTYYGHTANASVVTNAGIQTYYVRCKDQLDNKNTVGTKLTFHTIPAVDI